MILKVNQNGTVGHKGMPGLHNGIKSDAKIPPRLMPSALCFQMMR